MRYGRENYPGLFRGDLTFNSGGSTTYALYDESTPANDIAAGSCLVMPSTFDVFTLSGHLPALFIAAPVLKKIDGFGVPFIEGVPSARRVVGPQYRRHLLRERGRMVGQNTRSSGRFS